MSNFIEIKGKITIDTPTGDCIIENLTAKTLLEEGMKAIAINKGYDEMNKQIEEIKRWLNEDWCEGILRQFTKE